MTRRSPSARTGRRSPHLVARLVRLSAITIGLAGLASLTLTRPAHAWDPSTTHQGMLEAGVTRSALHLRWMDASELERGLFSDLRVDPKLLDEAELRLLQLTLRDTHADVGAEPLGGPGACPPAEAPPSTQLFCVDKDVWEQSALGWMRLGMIAEVTPEARLVHHFLDRAKPDATTWEDPELSGLALRRRQITNGEPLAGVLTGTNFDGKAQSALGWLADSEDLLAPTKLYQHLELASTAPTQAERDHHLALALLGIGALLHVVQDLGVPAHARGDGAAFFAKLSAAAGDRGLPLQEFVRVEYGRSDLPGVPTGIPTTAPTGVPLSETLLGHLFGDDSPEAEAQLSPSGVEMGLATLARERFFSESTLPDPRYLEVDQSAAEAAKTLLGDDTGLAAAELEGAQLAPWPAERGYLISSTGRALAAFDTDFEGRIQLYLDETVYREQASTLIPAAVEVTRSLLDLLWPAWPDMRTEGTSAVHIEAPASWASAELLVLVEDERGTRREHDRSPLVIGESNEVALPELGEHERVVLVLLAKRVAGPPIVIEQVLGAKAVERANAPRPTSTTRGPNNEEPGPLGPPPAPIEPQVI